MNLLMYGSAGTIANNSSVSSTTESVFDSVIFNGTGVANAVTTDVTLNASGSVRVFKDSTSGLNNRFQRVITDSVGNFYACTGMHVFKFNSQFNLLWKKTTNSNKTILALAVDASQNVYVLDTLVASGLKIAVLKLDSLGNKVSYNYYPITFPTGSSGSATNHWINEAKFDSSGTLVFTGVYIVGSNNYGFFGKIDAAMAMSWCKRVIYTAPNDTGNNAIVNGLATDSSNNIYISSNIIAATDGAAGSRTAIYKYDSTGALLTAGKPFTLAGAGVGAANEFVGEIAVIGTDIYVVSSMAGNASYGTYLAKLTDVNTVAWAKQFVTGSTSYYANSAISVDSGNNIYIHHDTSGDIDGYDYRMIFKYNTSGGLLWSKGLKVTQAISNARNSGHMGFNNNFMVVPLNTNVGGTYKPTLVAMAFDGNVNKTDLSGYVSFVDTNTYVNINNNTRLIVGGTTPVSGTAITPTFEAATLGSKTDEVFTVADAPETFTLTNTPNSGYTKNGFVIGKCLQSSSDWIMKTSFHSAAQALRLNVAGSELSTTVIGDIKNGSVVYGTVDPYGINTVSNKNLAMIFKEDNSFMQMFNWSGSGSVPAAQTLTLTVPVGFVMVTGSGGTDPDNKTTIWHRSMTGASTPSANGTGTGTLAQWPYGTQLDLAGNDVLTLTNYLSVSNSQIQFSQFKTAGVKYTATVFGHDTSTNGLIQCGTFTSTGNVQEINIGWEPDCLLLFSKDSTVSGSTKLVLTKAMGLGNLSASTGSLSTLANLGSSAAEANASLNWGTSAVGFLEKNNNGSIWYYVAIRKRKKTSFASTDVFTIAKTDTTAYAAKSLGYVDMVLLAGNRSANVTGNRFAFDRYHGILAGDVAGTSAINLSSSTAGRSSITPATTPSATTPVSVYRDNNGKLIMSSGGNNLSLSGAIGYGFKTAPGFFSICHHEGLTTPRHGLGAIPEFVLTVPLNASGNRAVYCKAATAGKEFNFSSNAAAYARTLYSADPDITYLYINSVGSSQIATATVGSAGSGYSSTPTLTVSGGGGSGAVLTANMVPAYTGSMQLNTTAYTSVNTNEIIIRNGIIGTFTANVSGGDGTGFAATARIAGITSNGVTPVNNAWAQTKVTPGAGYTTIPFINNSVGDHDTDTSFSSLRRWAFAKNNSTNYLFVSTALELSTSWQQSTMTVPNPLNVYKLPGQGYLITTDGTGGVQNILYDGNGTASGFGNYSMNGQRILSIGGTPNDYSMFVTSDNKIYRSVSGSVVCDYSTLTGQNAATYWADTGYTINSQIQAGKPIVVPISQGRFIIVPEILDLSTYVALQHFSSATAAPVNKNTNPAPALAARGNVIQTNAKFLCGGPIDGTNANVVVYGTDAGLYILYSTDYFNSWSVSYNSTYLYGNANYGMEFVKATLGNGVIVAMTSSTSTLSPNKVVSLGAIAVTYDLPNSPVAAESSTLHYYHAMRAFVLTAADQRTYMISQGLGLLKITNAGSGYNNLAPNVTFNYYDSQGGNNNTNVTSYVNCITGIQNGTKLGSVNIVNPGNGYTSAPTVTVSGGGGTGATVTVTLGSGTGYIGSINVTNGGSNYATAPTVSFSGGGGTGVTATANMVPNYTGQLLLNYGAYNYSVSATEIPVISGIIGTPTVGGYTGNAVFTVRNGGGAGEGYSKTPVSKRPAMATTTFANIVSNGSGTDNASTFFWKTTDTLQPRFSANSVLPDSTTGTSSSGLSGSWSTTPNFYKLEGDGFVAITDSTVFASAYLSNITKTTTGSVTLGNGKLGSICTANGYGMAVDSTGSIYRYTGSGVCDYSKLTGANWTNTTYTTLQDYYSSEIFTGGTGPDRFFIAPKTVAAGTASVVIQVFDSSSSVPRTVTFAARPTLTAAGGTRPALKLLCGGTVDSMTYVAYGSVAGVLVYVSSDNWTSPVTGFVAPTNFCNYSEAFYNTDIAFAAAGNKILVAVVKSTSTNNANKVYAMSLKELTLAEELFTGTGTPAGIVYYADRRYFTIFKSDMSNVVFGHGNAMLGLSNPGSGYSSVPSVTVTLTGFTTTSTGFTSLQQLGDKVGSVTVNTVGSGYSSAPTVSFSGGSGTGAAATAILVTGNSYVTGVSMTNNGTGYTSAPTVAFTGGGGSGASATANLVFQANGPITGGSVSTVTASGGSYTAAPTVTFAGGAGTGAAATVTLSATSNGGHVVTNGTLASVTVNDGGQYHAAPTATVSGGSGTGATVSVTLSATSNGGHVNVASINSCNVTYSGNQFYAASPVHLTFTGGNPTRPATGYMDIGTTPATTSSGGKFAGGGVLVYGSSLEGYIPAGTAGPAFVENIATPFVGTNKPQVYFDSITTGYFTCFYRAFSDGSSDMAVWNGANSGVIVSRGSGYTPGTYDMYLPNYLGTGREDPIRITIGSGGQIDSVTVNWAGRNSDNTWYKVEGPNLTNNSTTAVETAFSVTVGGGTGGSIKPFLMMDTRQAIRVPAGGFDSIIASYSDTSKGCGYKRGQVKELALLTTNWAGSVVPIIPVTLVVLDVTPILYPVTYSSVIMTDPGAGYTSTPTVSLRSFLSTEIAPNLTVNVTPVLTYAFTPYTYPIQSINVTASGSGYLSAPTINISGGGSVKPGSVSSILLSNNNYYYTSAPTVTISGGGGSGATATATVALASDYGNPLINSGSIEAYTLTEGYCTPYEVAYSDDQFVIPTNTGALAQVTPHNASSSDKIATIIYTPNSSINTVPASGFVSAGSGYTPGTYNQTIPNYFVGDGAGTMSVTVAANGTVSSVTFTNTGSKFYKVEAAFGSAPPTVAITVGGGAGAVVKLFDYFKSINVYRILTTANVIRYKGAGYAQAQLASMANKTIPNTNGDVGWSTFGDGANKLSAYISLPKITVTTISPLLLKVTGINITAGGSGYTSPPTVTFRAPTGYEIGTTTPEVEVAMNYGAAVTTGTAPVAATVTPNMNYTYTPYTYPIASINLTNGGSGYTGTPTISLSTGTGSGGTATVTAMAFTYGPSTYTVGSITVNTAGTGYTSAPTVSITGGGGTGAAGTASISVGTATEYVSYCWASVPGVSKVGSYVGNAGVQNIECNFSNGSRFVIIKSENTGYWYAFDSVRGITATNDPALIMDVNGNLGEQSYDSVDPYSGGFALQYNANVPVNSNGEKYIFLAIA